MEGADPGATEVTGSTLLVVNPASGSYSEQRAAWIVGELTRLGRRPQVISARNPAEVAAGLRTAPADGSDRLIVVAAGDGTINAVVNALEPGTAVLAVLPMGTSNVLAAELGIGSLEEGIRRIARYQVRPLPVGLLETGTARHRFLLMAGIGLDGAVTRDVRPREKRLLRQGAFALSALRNLWPWDAGMVDVSCGDRAIRCHSVVVCNASRYGGDFVLAAGADLLTPGFTVVCVTDAGRSAYVRAAGSLFLGNGLGPGAECIEAAEVTVSGRKPIQIDGDFIGYSPATITTETDVVRIVV